MAHSKHPSSWNIPWHARMIEFCAAAEKWLVKLLFGQLFLTTFSLPILLWWGLPFSALTIVGNVIFNPFIGLFLLLSTLLFFCELASFPSFPLVWLLERLTDFWLWCVAHGSRYALIALPRPPTLVMLGIAAAALWIMYAFSHNQKSGILVFSLFLLTVGVGLRYAVCPRSALQTIPYSSGALTVVVGHRRALLFDTQGLLRVGRHNHAWVDFSLRPELVSKFGRVSCDVLVLMQPTVARLYAARDIAQKMRASYIVVPEELYRGIVATHAAQLAVPVIPVSRELLSVCCSAEQEIQREQAVKKLWYTIKNFNSRQGLRCLKKQILKK